MLLVKTSYQDRYPKITIITPSFNQGIFIERTINSVLDQGYPNLEYIIIDGGSEDNTIEIVKKYENKLAYWVSEEDRGQAHAINKGLALATGEIINWINSDDLLAPGALLKLASLYKPEADFYLGKTKVIDEYDTVTGQIAQTNYSGKNIYDCFETGLNQPGSFFNRRVIETIGTIDEHLHYSFDLDLWKRFLLNVEQPVIVKTEDFLALFRLHSTSKTNIQESQSDSRFDVENKEAMSRYFSILKGKQARILFQKLSLPIPKSPPPQLNTKIVEKLASDYLYLDILLNTQKYSFSYFKQLFFRFNLSFVVEKLLKKTF